MRTFKTIGIVFGIYIASFVLDIAVASGTPEYQGGITAISILGFLAFLAPKVGYRWFDCFFAAIPFYGIFFIFRIAHRIAFLPQREWSERVQ
jgi:hypothetical protein